jgi:protoporphyrin/coproporphyrin ferrochelatase
MRFAAEPAFAHDRAERTAILLVNLGTPDVATLAALRRYLAEFLWDPRVVEIPRPLWWLILHGIVLRLRPAKSAAKYASIWRSEGSPLLYWTQRVAQRLRGHLGENGVAVPVAVAMRYGAPSLASALDALKADGATRILVLPLYPQYAAATTASAIDAVGAWAARTRRLPALRFVDQYHDDPGYIAALATGIRNHWQREGRGDVLVMSFHGLPARSLALGDPYFCQCQATARLLAAALGLADGAFVVTFQSRFGRAKWLQPYTEATVRQLAGQGRTRIDLVCPGFAVDCLETLEEIAGEVRAAFLAAGGQEFSYIECLNDADAWIAALGGIARRHLAGWPTAAADADELAARALRARALGAAA